MRTTEGLYGVVIDIDEDRERAYYVSVYSDGEIDWNFWTYFDDITTIYTRYPDSTSSDDTLANGKTATTKNVTALLDDLENDYSGTKGRIARAIPPMNLERALVPKGLLIS